MTPTYEQVVEAMARAGHDAERQGFSPWADLARAAAEGSTLAAAIMEMRRNQIRAAIRDLPPGWVVAKVPEKAKPGVTLEAQVWASGHNAALALVRASAVEVE